jgi:hypothetical protein
VRAPTVPAEIKNSIFDSEAARSHAFKSTIFNWPSLYFKEAPYLGHISPDLVLAEVEFKWQPL